MEILNELLASFELLGCNMSIKIHFLFSHLEELSHLINFGDVRDGQGEQFNQSIKVMEGRYQGRWDIHLITDYCWSLEPEQ